MHLRAFNNKHAGKKGYVIGGGPSILELQVRSDLSLLSLQKEITVGANKAYRIYEGFEPTYLAFCDWKFCVLYGKEMAREIPTTVKFTKELYINRIQIDIPRLYGIPVNKENQGKGILSTSFDEPMAFPNAGGTALIIAYLLGLNPIYLVGIDCKNYYGVTQFHNDYDRKDQDRRIESGLYERMLIVFESLLSQLKECGIEVYSCSSISDLNQFIPYVDIRSTYE